ncbi:MAG TPA: T9SS type A sorting domain-containing protein [Ignavibacteriaceae bacterium]|nr:T9SS type A sorting domain-containing protein [Ignavibacteriaceae bacterium]
MKSYLKYSALIVLMLFGFNTKTSAQWSTDPAVNLQVCDVTGDQALPKIANTSDGGCYISWFDNRNGSYAVYLQRLDPQGNKLWDTNGLLISNNSQSSSLVDWAIASDNHDNAIVTFTDTRDNDSLHAFAYLVDTTGTMLWGANGIRLSGNGDYQPNPVACQTSDGNYVFAWIIAADTQKIALQKISLAGQKMWGPDPVIYASGTAENYTYPAIVPSDNGSAVVVHTGYTGPFFAAVVHIYAQKFDTDGNPVWANPGGVVIQDHGGIPFYVHPTVIRDNADGVFVAWYDDWDSNNLFSSFAQHVTSTGTVTFPANGAEVSTNASMHHIYPTLAYNSGADELYAFWLEETSLQDQFAVYGQKFDATGTRQWTANGMSFTSMTSNAMFAPSALPTDTSVYVIYLQGNPSGLTDGVYAFMVNSSGDFSWSPNMVTMSDPTPQKLHSVTTIWSDDIAKIAWEDTRNDGGGIYAQNINPTGELGNIAVPVELTSFAGISNGNDVTLNWQTATEINNRGFEIERQQNGIWQTLGFIEGNGTTTSPHSYSYSDKNLNAGTYSYRLKQIDNNGTFKYLNLSESFDIQPEDYSLSQNYPNPFNPSTMIKYSIPEKSHITIKIYNVLGSEVAVLVNEEKPAGSYEVNFNAADLSSGVYYYTISAGNFNETRKMILLK